MATKEDQKNEIPESGENQENPENPEEEVEEPVDEELQKEMKGLKIEDADFTSEPKTKKHGKKSKNPEEKKGKKKGQDFLDFANKNNIEINIEYESKYQQKKNENQKYGNGNNRFNDNKKPYNKGGYKNDKTHPQKKQQPKFTGNKFDTFGQRPPHQNYQNYHQTPKLTENKEILEYLEKIFGEQNLNKDTYIRNRLKDGKICLDDIVAYNDIKNNNITADKILEIIKDSQNLECINEDNKNYIKIKNIDKLNLLKLEEIIAKKKAGRMNRNPYAQMMGPQPFPFGYNYINMQNNFYFYNKNPPYNYQTAGYIPMQENK